jgi:hypothetical protein
MKQQTSHPFSPIAKVAAMALLAVVLTAAAEAAPRPRACDLVIQELGEAKINGYDALSGGDYLEPIRLRLRNRGDETCGGVLRISRTASFDQLDGPQGNYMNYSIVDPTNIGSVLLDPVTQQGQALPISVAAGATVEIRPRLLVPGGQSGRQGRYYATLLAKVDQGANVPSVETEFNVSAQVQSRVQANFVGGRNAQLDLGELSPALSRSINMQVRATADIDIEISSEHQGNLKHEQGSALIPYSMTVANRAIDLSDTSSFNMPLANGIRGQNLPVTVTVGQFSNAPVGEYGDVVTFTISAR